MNAKTLRITIMGLLLGTGVFHLAVALISTGSGLAFPLTVFGLIYTGLSFFVRADTNDGSKSHSRNAIIASILACGAGLGLGGSTYIANGGPGALPVMFLIDIVIIAAGVMWLMKTKGKKKA